MGRTSSPLPELIVLVNKRQTTGELRHTFEMLQEKVNSCHGGIKRNPTIATLTFFSFFLFLPAEKQSLDQSAEPATNTEQGILL